MAPKKNDEEQRKEDHNRKTREYHKRMREMTPAGRMAYKLAGVRDRAEKYLDDISAWPDIDVEKKLVAEGIKHLSAAIKGLSKKPKSYAPVEKSGRRSKVEVEAGAVVKVKDKWREDYLDVFTKNDLDSLVVKKVKGKQAVVESGDGFKQVIPVSRLLGVKSKADVEAEATAEAS